MKELLQEWCSNNIARNVEVSEEIRLLSVYRGYRSGNETGYNLTLDKVIINPEHPSIKVEGLSTALNLYKPKYDLLECVAAVRVTLFDNTTEKNLREVMPPFTSKHFNGVMNSNVDDSEKINAISSQLYNFFNGEGGFNFADMKPTIFMSCFEYVVDWNKTFEGLSSVEIVKWLLAVKMGTYFNLPTDFRHLEKTRKTDRYSSSKLIKHPLFVLMEHLKFIEGVETPDFSGIQAEYIDALLNGSEKSRTQYCTVVQKVEATLGRLIQALAQSGVLYLPYDIPNVATKTSLAKADLPWNTCLGKVCLKLYSEAKGQKDQTVILRFLRNVSRSSNLTDCDDIPEEYPSDLTKILKDYQNGKGYQTATGFPFSALKKIINEHEKTAPEGVKFNPAFLHNITANRIKHSDTRKSSYELNHAKDVIGEDMLSAMRQFLKTKGSKHSLKSLTDMVDWLREIRKEGVRFNEIEDFKHTMFFDPMDTREVHKTLYTFYKEKDISDNSRSALWSGLHAFFSYWAASLSVDSGGLLTCPVPKSEMVFPLGGSHRSITVREAMPSVLHEKCIEVLKENNYEICAKVLPSQKDVEVTNQSTGKTEVINNNTVARCLHLLLLLPVRGKQARWLDEGVLDDRIWCVEKQRYIKNTHPLSHFKYPDGKSHSERCGKSGVLKNKQASGNDTLMLHINTNKTQSYNFAKQGKLGYDIPWPYGSGISQIDDVWSIIEAQREFNNNYMYKDVEPIRLDDEEPNIYEESVREKLPYFVPLFREIQPQVSRANPRERFNLAYPISKANITKLFRKVLLEAEQRYKTDYPQFKNQSVVKTENGQWMYDIHSLRVYGVTELIEKGMPVEVVQMIVGHATSVMTHYYYKLKSDTLKTLLIKAKKKQGIAIENQKKMYDENDTEGLIALFDLVEEWRKDATSDASRNKVVPNFSGGGVNKVIKGGVCGSFDCDSGGIKIVVHKNGTAVEPSATQGGKFRCGNCRYWRSGPRFILEQIYEINVIAEEIRELRDRRKALIEKSHEVRADAELENRSFIAERLDRDVDKEGEILACRVIELRRRQLMLDESLQKAGVNSVPDNSMMIPEELGRESGLSSVPKWEEVSDFNACRELQTQAAVLGLPISDNEVSMRKIEKFISQALSVSGESSNPFLFMPNDEVKRVALLYAIANSCEKLGREFSDAEFNDPRLLKKALGIKNMKALVTDPLSLKKEDGSLELNYD